MENDKITSNTAGLNRNGRPKGATNKVTRAAKDAISIAAEELGGADRLVEWAKEDPANERAFWTTIYPKLLPLQVNGAGEDGQHVIETIKRVVIDPSAHTHD